MFLVVVVKFPIVSGVTDGTTDESSMTPEASVVVVVVRGFNDCTVVLVLMAPPWCSS